MVFKIIVTLSPVFLLLVVFLLLDNMRLVNKKILLACLGWGILSAALSFHVNTLLVSYYHLDFAILSGYVAPFVEEFLKIGLILMLIKRNRVGFMIDGAIYGFSTGAAFSLAENIFFLIHYSQVESNLMTWIIRGFGTAVMHGGTTAMFTILVVSSLNRRVTFGIAVLLGAVAAILIHACFNALVTYPVIATIFVMVVIPVSLILSFHYSEKAIRNWLELEFDTEVALLRMIRQGKFSETRVGDYLLSIRKFFPGEVVFDLYCFISLYTELSITAKRVMILRENDFIVNPDPGILAKLRELKSLKRRIGRSGFLAITPILRMNQKDLWKLSLLAAGE